MYFSALLSLVLFFVSLVVPTLSTPVETFPGLDFVSPPLTSISSVIHQFPVGTWVENLALRRNGKILATTLSSPDIYQVDPEGRKPLKLIHHFDTATSCTGITKMGREQFYAIAGNFSLSTFQAVPGSWSLYKVDLRPYRPMVTKSKPARVSLVASFPGSIFLNGITVLSKSKKWLLVSDSGAGVVYRVEVKTGKVVKVLEDELMQPQSPSVFGINGIEIWNDQLYFTNSDRNILARMLIEDDGTSRASAVLVTSVNGPDDFSFNKEHNVVVAQSGVDLLGRVADGGEIVTLAGGPSSGAPSNDTLSTLFGPTAIRFGRGKKRGNDKSSKDDDWTTAYISTNGGTAQYLTGSVTRGGTITSVDVQGYW